MENDTGSCKDVFKSHSTNTERRPSEQRTLYVTKTHLFTLISHQVNRLSTRQPTVDVRMMGLFFAGFVGAPASAILSRCVMNDRQLPYDRRLHKTLLPLRSDEGMI